MPALAPVGRFAIRPLPATVDLFFVLSKKGKVDTVELKYRAEDSLVFEPFRDSLQKIEFSPAELSGKRVKFRLPARLVVSKRLSGLKHVTISPKSRGDLILPVDSVGSIVAHDLVDLSLAEAGREIPQLEAFPPYFYSRPSIAEDTARLYHVALVRVGLDSSGSPIDRELVYASDPRLGEMTLIASGWARYRGAKVAGRGVASQGYVLVSFYRELNYPTGEWRPPVDSLADRLEYVRVRWYGTPGLDEFELGALPRRVGGRLVRLARGFVRTVPVTGLMYVDSAGAPDVRVLSGRVTNQLKTDLHRRISAFRYYPALRLKLTDSGYGDSKSRLDWSAKFDTLIFDLIPVDTFDYHMRIRKH